MELPDRYRQIIAIEDDQELLDTLFDWIHTEVDLEAVEGLFDAPTFHHLYRWRQALHARELEPFYRKLPGPVLEALDSLLDERLRNDISQIFHLGIKATRGETGMERVYHWLEQHPLRVDEFLVQLGRNQVSYKPMRLGHHW